MVLKKIFWACFGFLLAMCFSVNADTSIETKKQEELLSIKKELEINKNDTLSIICIIISLFYDSDFISNKDIFNPNRKIVGLDYELLAGLKKKKICMSTLRRGFPSTSFLVEAEKAQKSYSGRILSYFRWMNRLFCAVWFANERSSIIKNIERALNEPIDSIDLFLEIDKKMSNIDKMLDQLGENNSARCKNWVESFHLLKDVFENLGEVYQKMKNTNNEMLDRILISELEMIQAQKAQLESNKAETQKGGRIV